jgi:hypothetical protein
VARPVLEGLKCEFFKLKRRKEPVSEGGGHPAAVVLELTKLLSSASDARKNRVSLQAANALGHMPNIRRTLCNLRVGHAALAC